MLPSHAFLVSRSCPGLAVRFAMGCVALALTVGDPPEGRAAPSRNDPPPPDLTAGAPAPDAKQHDWTLGPTGLRGWMFARRMETSEARQIYVTKVDAGSPAEGAMAVGDVILGVGAVPFAGDARVAFGRAVTDAEAGDGVLRLLRWRSGQRGTVELKLPAMGRYRATAPYDCPKSARILEQGCRTLAAKMKSAPPARRGNPIERSLNALALLASGRAEYLPLVSEEAQWAAGFSTPDDSLPTWWYGYVSLFLSEYILSTGDRSVLPGLQRLTLKAAKGQSRVGTWGHGFAVPNVGNLGGYGAMNQPGLSLSIGLVLARKAGVADPALDLAIERSARFLSFYTGKGCIPYGDHHPWMETHDDNGKCGAGAILFDLLGDRPSAAFFSRMTTASYGSERDIGHTGNFFNMFWALPGVSRSGPQATGAWLAEFGWYYDLARRWDGTFVYQGEPMPVEDNKYKGWDSTGAYLLAYAVSQKKTFFTGRSPSIAPQLDAAAARRIIEDGRDWSPATKIAGYAKRSDTDLWEGLANWSPVVRERSAQELSRRPGDPVPRLLTMLGGTDACARHGACAALSALGGKAAAAVPALRQTLWDDDLWLRIEAAKALANIGDAGRPAVPDLLRLLATKIDSDPRGMIQRYVTFSLFYPGRVLDVHGMLAGSLDGVDRRLLYPAVESALRNEDGRSREAVGSVYEHLTFEEIRPLLPAIYRAIVEPAPSGEMFADGIRLRGLELLAKYRIAEGVPLCVSMVEPKRWGLSHRIDRLLKVLVGYGAAAKSQIPALRELETELSVARANQKDRVADVRRAIAAIEASTNRTPLRSLAEAVGGTAAVAEGASPGRAVPGSSRTLKVFILAGQSNMEGQGVIDLTGRDYNGGRGTLVSLFQDPAKEPLVRHLRDARGQWAVRDDVWVRYKREQGPMLRGPLGPGFSVYGDVHHLGPELQFGHVLGDALEDQVLLMKTAWGGKSLYKDFRPPSSGGAIGPYYTKMIADVREAIDNLKTDFPAWAGGPSEIAGLVWYQGWNDGCDPKHAVPEYETNLVNLIRDVRRDLKSPDLPVVIGELTGPWVEAPGEWGVLRRAQAAAASRPDFRGNVRFVATHDFVRAAADSPNTGHGHHEFGNAETVVLVGDALGRAMAAMLDERARGRAVSAAGGTPGGAAR